MRPRRNLLQVSTFPFLAVLLCAMGSLILLLLVIDRRAKVVARAKAMRIVERRAVEMAAATARRHEEIEKHAALRDEKRKEARALIEQLQAVESETNTALAGWQAETARRSALERKIEALAAEISKDQRELREQELALDRTHAEKHESRRQREQMAKELAQLETIIANLKTSQAREQHTYSLVPYRGKRGDNRKPIYVECSATGLVLHPGRRRVEINDLGREMERRVGVRSVAEGEDPARPYVLFLVRPAGIMVYYQALTALDGKQMDFGYEFVEPDWEFDFTDDGEKPQRPVAEEQWPVASNQRSPARNGHQGSPAAARPSAAGTAVSGEGWSPGGAGAGTSPPPDNTGVKSAPDGWHARSTVSPGRPGIGAKRNSSAPAVAQTEAGAMQVGGNPPGPGRLSNQGNDARPESPKPSSGEAASPRPTLGPATPADTAASNTARAGPLPPSRDWVITVECTAAAVVISPGGMEIPLTALAGQKRDDPLRQTIHQMIERRRSMARPGETPDRVVIHFQVRPSGLRAYHMAYPALETLKVPMTRENLRNDSESRSP
jgi:hypothetical protein